jgi:hypothetical protein
MQVSREKEEELKKEKKVRWTGVHWEICFMGK